MHHPFGQHMEMESKHTWQWHEIHVIYVTFAHGLEKSIPLESWDPLLKRAVPSIVLECYVITAGMQY